MELDGKIYRLECLTDYAVAKSCVIKDTCCAYNSGLPGPLGSTIFALKTDFNSCKPGEIQMQRMADWPLVQENDLTVI